MARLTAKIKMAKCSYNYMSAEFAARITPKRMEILSRRWGEMYPELKNLDTQGLHSKYVEKMGLIADGLESGVKGLPAAQAGLGGKPMNPVPILEQGTHKLLGVSAMTPQNPVQNRMAYYPNPRPLLDNDNPAWYPTTKRGATELTPAHEVFRTLKERYPGNAQVALSGNMGINESMMKAMGLPAKEAVERRATNPNFLLKKVGVPGYEDILYEPNEIAEKGIRMIPKPPEKTPARPYVQYPQSAANAPVEISPTNWDDDFPF